MAVIKQTTLISPSADYRTKNELDSLELESGMYYCNESVTIGSVTSSLWTVFCVSNYDMRTLHCFTQIWIPSATGGTNLSDQHIFVRTSALESATYSSFTEFTGGNSGPELVVSSTQPSLSGSGETKIWIQYPTS